MFIKWRKKMKTRISTAKRYLFEAYRHNQMIDPREPIQPLTKRWLGLGTVAAYRPMLKADLMRFHDGEIPPARCMGWLVLTKKGVELYHKYENEFETEMQRLNESEKYKSSILSCFTVAGGLVSK